MRDAFEHGLQWSDVLVLTDELQRRWPLVFNPLHRRPLKTGVHHDIIAAMPEVNRYLLAITMRRWCQHVDYLRGVALGRHRHSLDGEDVSDLSPEEREAAQVQWQKARERWAAQEAKPAPARPKVPESAG